MLLEIIYCKNRKQKWLWVLYVSPVLSSIIRILKCVQYNPECCIVQKQILYDYKDLNGVHR